MDHFLIYMIIVNVFSFFACGMDKFLARAGGQRISEFSLFLLCFAGGCFGFYPAMFAFHHKTLHKRFVVGVPLIIAAWAALIIWVYLF